MAGVREERRQSQQEEVGAAEPRCADRLISSDRRWLTGEIMSRPLLTEHGLLLGGGGGGGTPRRRKKKKTHVKCEERSEKCAKYRLELTNTSCDNVEIFFVQFCS